MSIIFIAGLSRSGTTFLQSQLVKYDNVIALGEVAQTIRAIKNISTTLPSWKVKTGLKSENYWNTDNYDTLIARVRQDTFWGPLEQHIKNVAGMKEAVELVYKNAFIQFPSHVFIDSSKHIGHLSRLVEIESLKREVKILHCIRDYRGWLYSVKKHQQRTKIHQRSNLIEIYKWWYSNKKLRDFLLANLQSGFKLISYEKLVFAKNEVMASIEKFCNLAGVSDSSSIEKFHEILGSQTLRKGLQERDVVYDCSWFSYTGYGLLQYPVHAFNKRIYLKYS